MRNIWFNFEVFVIQSLSYTDYLEQSLSYVWLFVTPWPAACQISQSLLSPGVCSESCTLSPWCYPTISSSVTPFSSWLQSLPASGSFSMSWLFAPSDQIIGTSALASVLWEYSVLTSLRIDWFDLLAVQGELWS